MKAESLRLGNLVYRLDVGNILCVDEISSSGDIRFKDVLDSIFQIEDINPIPLTEEWSIKFGYECLVEMSCAFSVDSKYYGIEITSIDLKELKVHEAQNLYFALTGKELTLKQ